MYAIIIYYKTIVMQLHWVAVYAVDMYKTNAIECIMWLMINNFCYALLMWLCLFQRASDDESKNRQRSSSPER